MKTEIYNITGMHCAACSSAIERVTSKLNGVIESQVNLPMNRLVISYDDSLVTEEMIINKIQKSGFGAILAKNNVETIDSETISKENDDIKYERLNLIFAIIFSILLLYISMGQMLFNNLPIPNIISIHSNPYNFAIIQLTLTLFIIFFERKFFISGFNSLFHKTPNMDTLVAISATASFIYSFVMTLLININPHAVHNLYYESAAIILTLVSVGKFLEKKNVEKTKDAIASLINLTPPSALLVDENGTWEIPTSHLKIGDIVLVKAGESIPLDGIVSKGDGSIDESMLTGESFPIIKEISSSVIGGSIVTTGALYVQITHIGQDTTLSKIIDFVQNAQGKKAPISKIADKVAGIFIPVAILIAIVASTIWLVLGYDFSFAIKIFTTILVIACPCSMGLATPTSIVVGTGIAASNGILIRSGEALENTHKVSVAIFDKTGTITEGSPQVTDIFSNDVSNEQFLSEIIPIEELSNHPLAKAICKEESKYNLDLQNDIASFENINGFGIIAKTNNSDTYIIGNETLMKNNSIDLSNIQYEKLSDEGKTVVFVSKNNVFYGYLAITDKIKPSAIDAIKMLKTIGIKTVMLTGDNNKTASKIGKEVNIDEIISQVLPTEKANVIKRYQDLGHTVMMVGDGINDAPALAQSDIGCAIGSGSHIAIDSAQIILLKDDLLDVVKSIRLSKKTIKNIKQNLFWAFCYNSLCIPLAAGILYIPFGILLSPMIAGIAMSLSSLCVVSNALRLKGIKL